MTHVLQFIAVCCSVLQCAAVIKVMSSSRLSHMNEWCDVHRGGCVDHWRYGKCLTANHLPAALILFSCTPMPRVFLSRPHSHSLALSRSLSSTHVFNRSLSVLLSL